MKHVVNIRFQSRVHSDKDDSEAQFKKAARVNVSNSRREKGAKVMGHFLYPPQKMAARVDLQLKFDQKRSTITERAKYLYKQHHQPAEISHPTHTTSDVLPRGMVRASHDPQLMHVGAPRQEEKPRRLWRSQY
jgi:hypothetical protein